MEQQSNTLQTATDGQQLIDTQKQFPMLQNKIKKLGYEQKIEQMLQSGIKCPRRAFKFLQNCNGNVEQAIQEIKKANEENRKQRQQQKKQITTEEIFKEQLQKLGFQQQIQFLKENGFENIKQNIRLLTKFQGDQQAVLQVLQKKKLLEEKLQKYASNIQNIINQLNLNEKDEEQSCPHKRQVRLVALLERFNGNESKVIQVIQKKLKVNNNEKQEKQEMELVNKNLIVKAASPQNELQEKIKEALKSNTFEKEILEVQKSAPEMNKRQIVRLLIKFNSNLEKVFQHLKNQQTKKEEKTTQTKEEKTVEQTQIDYSLFYNEQVELINNGFLNLEDNFKVLSKHKGNLKKSIATLQEKQKQQQKQIMNKFQKLSQQAIQKKSIHQKIPQQVKKIVLDGESIIKNMPKVVKVAQQKGQKEAEQRVFEIVKNFAFKKQIEDVVVYFENTQLERSECIEQQDKTYNFVVRSVKPQFDTMNDAILKWFERDSSQNVLYVVKQQDLIKQLLNTKVQNIMNLGHFWNELKQTVEAEVFNLVIDGTNNAKSEKTQKVLQQKN